MCNIILCNCSTTIVVGDSVLSSAPSCGGHTKASLCTALGQSLALVMEAIVDSEEHQHLNIRSCSTHLLFVHESHTIIHKHSVACF